MLGKNVVTDFFGDMWRAGKQGVGQGATIDDALKLYASGSSISDEDLQEYIAAVGEMDNIGMSDEMRSFNKIYENNGGGVLGFVLGVGANPTVLGQLFVSSIASMVNPAVAAGAGAGAHALTQRHPGQIPRARPVPRPGPYCIRVFIPLMTMSV